MLNNKFILLLLTFTLIAIFSRLVITFNPYNYFFEPEQGTEYLVTKSIVIDHKIVLTAQQGGNPLGGLGDFFKGPGFNYLLIIPFILTGGDPFGGRLFMLIISVLTVPLAFILSNRMFGIKIAGIISFLLAISPNLKDYAGGISPPFVIPFLTVLFIYFLYMSFYGNKKFIPLLAFIVGLMTHFEMASSVILLAFLLLSSVVCIVKKTIPIRYYLLSIGAFGITILPLIIYDLNNNFYNAKGVLKMFEVGKTQSLDHLTSNFYNLINNRFDAIGWNFISTFSPNVSIWLLVLIILLFGIYLLIKDKKNQQNIKMFVLYLSSIPIFSLLFLIAYPGSVINQWWIIFLTIIYCYLFAILSNYLLKYTKFKALVILSFFALSIAFINRTVFLYRTQFIYPPDTYIKEDAAIKYIFNNAGSKQFGIIVLSKRAQENYDYLIWWNGNKFNYQPYRNPKGNYYVIIEPNLIYQLNKTPGKLIKTKSLNNGFTIEERLVY